jgi:hypothetical protein
MGLEKQDITVDILTEKLDIPCPRRSSVYKEAAPEMVFQKLVIKKSNNYAKKNMFLVQFRFLDLVYLSGRLSIIFDTSSSFATYATSSFFKWYLKNQKNLHVQGLF